jgi:hypothetical protein
VGRAEEVGHAAEPEPVLPGRPPELLGQLGHPVDGGEEARLHLGLAEGVDGQIAPEAVEGVLEHG